MKAQKQTKYINTNEMIPSLNLKFQVQSYYKIDTSLKSGLKQIHTKC